MAEQKTVAQVLVFRAGSLKPRDRKKLEAAGLVVVETENAADVVTITAAPSIVSGDAVFRALMYAVNQHACTSLHESFFSKLYALSNEPEKPWGAK